MRDHQRKQSTSSVSLPSSPKQLTRTESSSIGIRAEPRLARGTSVLDTVSSRFHDLSTFVTRHVNASVGTRSASPSLLVGSYPQSHYPYRQRSNTATGSYNAAYSPHRAILHQRTHRGPWPADANFNGMHGGGGPVYAEYGREGMHSDGKSYSGAMYAHDMGIVNGQLHVPHGQFPMDNEEPLRGAAMFNDGRRVLKARFQSLDHVAPIPFVDAVPVTTTASNTTIQDTDWRRRTALLMGYTDGFHIWDVSNVNEIREMASIRDTSVGQVMDLEIVPEPSVLPGDHLSGNQSIVDVLAPMRPLLAIVSAPSTESNWQDSLPPPVFSSDGMNSLKDYSGLGGDSSERAILIIYSLKTHQIVRKLTDSRADVMGVACNRHVIAMSLSDGRIRVVSNHDLSTIATFNDVLVTGEHPVPIFSLGSRWIAYVSASPPPPAFAGVLRTNDAEDTSTVEKVAREVMQGVKSLGSLGYKAMSDYLSSRAHTNEPQPTSNSLVSRQRSRRSSNAKDLGGVIVVRDLVAEKLNAIHITPTNECEPSSTTNNSISRSMTSSIETTSQIPTISELTGPFEDKVPTHTGESEVSDTTATTTTSSHSTSTVKPIVHFRAHEHNCSALKFDPSGFRLVTVSSRGDTFRVHSIAHGRASLLFTLSRGYTHAKINDLVFDHEARWFAVSTGHGTTHVFRLPSVEAQQSNVDRQGLSQSSGSWSKRTVFTDRAWPPVVRIRQKLDEDLETDDPSEAFYSGPVTPSTSYPNGGHRTPQSGGHGMPTLDATSVWANHTMGGPLMGEGEGAHTPPPPLAVRFSHFGQDRDQAVFIINGAGLLTMHRLKRGKTTELAMEAEDVAEWKLLRGEDWDTLAQPIQFTEPISLSVGASDEEQDRVSTPSSNNSNDSSNSHRSDEVMSDINGPPTPTKPVETVEIVGTVGTVETTELSSPKPIKTEKPTGKKAKRKSKSHQQNTSATVTSTSTSTSTTTTATNNGTVETVTKTNSESLVSITEQPLSSKPSPSVPTQTSTEAKWLAHAEIVTYPPHYARVLWNQPGFQFQVFDPNVRGDGGDLTATRPVDVNHPLPTPYGWARAENDGQAASGANLEECIRKAMQSDMDLSPASRELLDTQAARSSDPFTRGQPYSSSALMQHHDENDKEIVDMLRRRHRSPLLTPEDLDHDVLDEFDLYDQDYIMQHDMNGGGKA
ncbi:hypothetical protein BDF19DRAFT_419481 [Syncephalis fuscata]|nr:hypothetical protein BDF19DRAFT_419481 [Syncephalis fuscata]